MPPLSNVLKGIEAILKSRLDVVKHEKGAIEGC